MNAAPIAGTPNPPSRVRRRPAPLLVGLLLALGVVSVAQQPAPALQAEGYYSVPYSSTLYYYNPSNGSVNEASFAEFVSDGSPRPMPAPTSFVSNPWSPSIYAVSSFDDQREIRQLSYGEWQRAGFPAPSTAYDIAGSSYHKWDTGGDLFTTAPNGSRHKLTFAEWAASGFPQPEVLVNEGFQKLSWDGAIAYVFDVAGGEGIPITFPQWQGEDFPSPQTVNRFPGDSFCKSPSSSTIFYSGPSYEGSVNFDQWQAAGAPAPDRC